MIMRSAGPTINKTEKLATVTEGMCSAAPATVDLKYFKQPFQVVD